MSIVADAEPREEASAMTSIRVLIAGCEKADRAPCRSLLAGEKGIQVVGEAPSGLDVVAAAERLKPCVLLLDLALVNGTGRSLLPVIRRKSPQTKVLLLTGQASDARTLEALSHGARGYLDKRTLGTYLPRAVRAVNAGEVWVPRKMVAKIIDRIARLAHTA